MTDIRAQLRRQLEIEDESRALGMRRDLLTQLGPESSLAFVDTPGDVVHFCRGTTWHSITNFGEEPVELPRGEVLLSSIDLTGGRLPVDASAWILTDA